jgi:hypothetical protein
MKPLATATADSNAPLSLGCADQSGLHTFGVPEHSVAGAFASKAQIVPTAEKIATANTTYTTPLTTVMGVLPKNDGVFETQSGRQVRGEPEQFVTPAASNAFTRALMCPSVSDAT